MHRAFRDDLPPRPLDRPRESLRREGHQPVDAAHAHAPLADPHQPSHLVEKPLEVLARVVVGRQFHEHEVETPLVRRGRNIGVEQRGGRFLDEPVEVPGGVEVAHVEADHHGIRADLALVFVHGQKWDHHVLEVAGAQPLA